MTEKRESGKLIDNFIHNSNLSYMSKIFRQIEITEAIIEEHKKDNPLVSECFLAFHSDLVTPDFAPWIFRSHCKEIANRLKKVGKRWSKQQIFDLMQPPTKAEIVCALSDASMIAPLRRDGAALALHYFNEIAKEEGKEFKIDYIPISDLELKQAEEETTHYLNKFSEEKAKIVWEIFNKRKKEKNNDGKLQTNPKKKLSLIKFYEKGLRLYYTAGVRMKVCF